MEQRQVLTLPPKHERELRDTRSLPTVAFGEDRGYVLEDQIDSVRPALIREPACLR